MLTFLNKSQPNSKLSHLSLMKTIIKTAIFSLVMLATSAQANAQFFKKLKDKVKTVAEETFNRKVEDKTMETTEKAVDSIFSVGKKRNKNKKIKKQPSQTPKEQEGQEELPEEKTYGSATIKGPNHPPAEILNIAQPKVTLNPSKTTITAWWWTHGTDTNDNFTITLNQKLTEDTPLPLTINLEEEGNLALYYDGLLGAFLPEDQWRREADPNYEMVHQVPNVKGTLTITKFSKNSIAFNFNGPNFKGKVQVQDPLIKVEQAGTIVNTKTIKADQPAFEFKDGEPGFYEFDYDIQTIVTQSDGTKNPIGYLINTQTNYYGIKAEMGAYGDGTVDGNSVILMDKDKVRVFVDSPMMKIQMNQDMPKPEDSPMPDTANYDYTMPIKTGETKTILGYQCNAYVVKHNNAKVTFWATPDLHIPNWMFGSQQAAEQTGVLGFVLAFSTQDQYGTTSSEVTAINKNPSFTIQASEYRKMF